MANGSPRRLQGFWNDKPVALRMSSTSSTGYENVIMQGGRNVHLVEIDSIMQTKRITLRLRLDPTLRALAGGDAIVVRAARFSLSDRGGRVRHRPRQQQLCENDAVLECDQEDEHLHVDRFLPLAAKVAEGPIVVHAVLVAQHAAQRL